MSKDFFQKPQTLALPRRERTAYVRDATRIRHVSDLETTVAAWLQPRAAAPERQQPKPPPGQLPLESPLCVLSGGPGSGKSSFCKKLAARLAEEGRHVLLIPLHHFTLKGDLPAAIDSCIAERLGFLHHKPMENRRALFAGRPPLRRPSSSSSMASTSSPARATPPRKPPAPSSAPSKISCAMKTPPNSACRPSSPVANSSSRHTTPSSPADPSSTSSPTS